MYRNMQQRWFYNSIAKIDFYSGFLYWLKSNLYNKWFGDKIINKLTLFVTVVIIIGIESEYGNIFVKEKQFFYNSSSYNQL